ncbi:MAG: lysophospholipid acyltransferase family protein [Acidimicrobiales bacterium]|nr:lysophospholipid acyltransferase family protein [Acidimicrobiales bacterium]
MQTKYGRRLVTIPGMLLTAIALAITAPILVPVLAVADLMTGWRRRRLLRLWAMASSYVWFELVGITVSGVLWTLSGFGLLMHVRAIRRAHHRLHWWWTGSLVRAMQRFLALELEIDGDLPHGRPLVVISRHCSFGDALLPSALLGEHHRYELRHVLKRELVWDPCLDLVGNRLENHFVDRAPDDNSSELEAIRSLAIGIRGAQAAVIFPEGTFRTPRRHERAVERLRGRQPHLADRAARMSHVLPPRPAGTGALLDAAPDADVLILGHVGFESFSSFAEIIANVPFRAPVRIRYWLHERATVPDDADARMAWLFEQWEHLDAWVASQRGPDPALRSDR